MLIMFTVKKAMNENKISRINIKTFETSPYYLKSVHVIRFEWEDWWILQLLLFNLT